MNFDTKYLIRWGIPGWIMIIVLAPFSLAVLWDELIKGIPKAADLVAFGALITVLGVPLGYLLNQIHHSAFWVVPKIGKWDAYFEEEIRIDNYFENTNGEKKRDRYRYLLSRKHELGGITISLGISVFVILLVNIFLEKQTIWSWIYFIIVLILFLLILFSRQYSSKNIEKYHEHFLNKS